MKITIVSGSTRNVSQSIKVSNYIKHILETQLNQDVYLLDLAKANLKWWDESFWNKKTEFDPNWSIAKKELDNSDAVVIVVPEWNGMIPPALKNFFHLSTNGELKNKPGLIVSVSATINGVYPVTELRMNTYKNTFFCYLPHHVIVRNVNTVLNELNVESGEEDSMIRSRIIASLQVLVEYANAFKSIRNSEIVNNFSFPYGM